MVVMKIMIIRHGDPDYETDSLTEKGIREAEALHDFLKDKKYDAAYCSPLGRAQQTARIALGKDAKITTLDWLREFDAKIHIPNTVINDVWRIVSYSSLSVMD